MGTSDPQDLERNKRVNIMDGFLAGWMSHCPTQANSHTPPYNHCIIKTKSEIIKAF